MKKVVMLCVIGLLAYAGPGFGASKSKQHASAVRAPVVDDAPLKAACDSDPNPSQRLDACTQRLKTQHLSAPEQAATYVNIAQIAEGANDAATAMLHLNEAVRICPACQDALAGRGELEVAQSQYDQAIADLTAAINLNGQDADYFDFRGAAYTRMNRYAEAVADFSRAIALNPQFAQAYINRAAIRMAVSVQDYAASIQDYEQAVRLDPSQANTPSPYVAMAYSLRASKEGNAQGDWNAALQDTQRAQALDPNTPTYAQEVATARQHIQDAEELAEVQAQQAQQAQFLAQEAQQQEDNSTRDAVLGVLGAVAEAYAGGQSSPAPTYQAPAAPSPSYSYSSASSSRAPSAPPQNGHVHDPSLEATSCVHVGKSVHSAVSEYSLYNSCGYVVEVLWCETTGSCPRGFDSQATLTPGVQHPLAFSSANIRFGACREGDGPHRIPNSPDKWAFACYPG